MRASSADRSSCRSCCSGSSLTRELGIDDVLLGIGRGFLAGAIAARRAGGRGRGGRQSVHDLLEIGDERSHPIERGLFVDRRAGVGHELLRARLFVGRKWVLTL